jgi:hypothetical protein
MNASLRFLISAASAALIAAGCSGGTGGTGMTNSSTVSIGVMAKGSTIVNGVRFQDTTATITVDDTPRTAAIDLRDGMVVKLVGSINADGVTGTAQRIKALIEVRGTPTSVDPATQSFVLLNQIVLVDDQTILNNLASFANITTSTFIEVHGLRDATGRVRATRIEANATQMADATTDEIRGVVSANAGPNPTTFTLGSQAVNASAALIVPTGATYQNGSVVEVFCLPPCITGGVFQASRVKVENAQDTAFQPASGEHMEVEGLISGFTAHPGSFVVGNTPVTTTGSTTFEGGIATDLGNNVQVEAEGSWNGSTLMATKIEFQRSVVRLQGFVTAAGATTFTLNIAGNLVNVETNSGVVPSVNPTVCVQVRGQRKIPASPLVVTAGEITSCSNSGRPVIQAPVEAENPENTITLLGFVLDVSAPTDNPPFVDVNDLPISKTAFFTAVTPAGTNSAGVSVPGTLVKVVFDPSTNAVRQVELED